MAAWRRICCPVDFSEPSRAALREAADLARRFGAERVLLHVVEPAAPAGSELAFAPPPAAEPPATAPAPLGHWEAEARAIAGPVVRSVELGGDAADEIVRYAREADCDLVVMGTHGRTGWRRLVLGSVAAAVVRQTTCPVLVIPAGA